MTGREHARTAGERAALLGARGWRRVRDERGEHLEPLELAERLRRAALAVALGVLEADELAELVRMAGGERA